jgi:hypothetical protein
MKTTIKNLKGIAWENQIIEEGFNESEDLTLLPSISNGEIEIGDTVLVQDAKDCGLVGQLEDDDFLITFDKVLCNDTRFYQTAIFNLEECKQLFGEDFKYINYEEQSNLTEDDQECLV